MSVCPTSSPKMTRMFGFFASAAYVARGDRSAPIVRAKRIAARVNAGLLRLTSRPRRCEGSISAPFCICTSRNHRNGNRRGVPNGHQLRLRTCLHELVRRTTLGGRGKRFTNQCPGKSKSKDFSFTAWSYKDASGQSMERVDYRRGSAISQGEEGCSSARDFAGI